MEHETKHKDHQRRDNEVPNIWRTWMSRIPTKLEKNWQHLLPKMLWRRSPTSVKWLAWVRGGKMGAHI